MYVAGPSNNHSSPALRCSLLISSSKSRTAFKRNAELAGTTFRGVTGWKMRRKKNNLKKHEKISIYT